MISLKTIKSNSEKNKSPARHFFAVLATLLAFFSTILAPNQVFASGEIGTHLGEGDVSSQIMIMDFLESRIKDEIKSAFPVTIQVYISDTTQGDLQALAASVRRNGFFPIIRVNKVCTPAGVDDSTQFIGWIQEAFGNEVVIAWGNEVNNQVVECPNSELYWAGLSKVQNSVGPGSLDFYNSLFPAQPFAERYSNYSYYFANAYGCIESPTQRFTADTCDPLATESHLNGFPPPINSSTFYLTEFSLSPNDGVPNNNAPDTNLRKVADFIESQASLTGAEKITPLVRNVCGIGSKWLIFVSKTASRSGETEVYTADGTKIDIDSCASAQPEGDYYLYPIPGLYEIDNGPLNKEKIIDGLLNQGYQAQCLSPEIKIDALIDSLPDYLYDSRFIGVDETLEARLTQKTDFSASKIPGWRLDGDHKIQVINSLETLFGYQNPSLQEDLDTQRESNNNQENFYSAPIYRRTSLADQCVYQSRILDVIKNMCNKLANPGPDSCPLNKKIQGSSYDLFNLQAAMDEKIQAVIGQHADAPNPRESARSAVCQDLTQNTSFDDPIRLALKNTPLYLANAYRLGFLVMSAELAGKPTGLDDQAPFRFMRSQTQEELLVEPKHEVRIFAFRMPDIGTNRDPSSDIYYQDPIELVRDSFVDKASQNFYQEQYDKVRFEPNNFGDPIIKCEGNGYLCTGETTENPVVLAFVDFVNKYLKPPDQIKNTFSSSSQTLLAQTGAGTDFCQLESQDLPYQKIQQIFSSATISETEGKIYQGDQDIYENLQEHGVSQTFPITESSENQSDQSTENQSNQPTENQPDESTGDRSFDFIQEAKIRKETPGQAGLTQETVKINAYLIVPQGYQLGLTEDVLAGRFMEYNLKNEFFDAFNKPNEEANSFGKLKQYFSIEGVSQNILTFAQTTKRVVDTFNPIGCVDPNFLTANSVEPPCTVYSLMIRNNSNQNDHAPRLHGGILSEVLLNLQKSFEPIEQEGWSYLSSCETIEQFILGSCEGLEEGGGAVENKADQEIKPVAQCDKGSRITTGENSIHLYSNAALEQNKTCSAFASNENYSSYSTFKTIHDLKSQGLGTDLGLSALQSELESRLLNENYHVVERWRDPTDLPTGNPQAYCENLYSYVACTYPNSLIQNKVNNNGEWDNNGTETACEYVVRMAQSAGVSPRFALSMWGEESGFSHYQDAFAFGITSQPALELNKQVSSFLATVNNQSYLQNSAAHSNKAGNIFGNSANYLDFLEQYAGEKRGSNQFCNNPNFPARLKQFYYYLNKESR
jgi:hypothetical protein